MEGALRDLIRIKSVNLRDEKIDFAPHGFAFLGIASSIPDLGIHSGEVFIWHAQAGILPITKSEVIRFGMDAPSGLHIILSERIVQSDCYSVESFEFRILEPDEISTWVGKAILSGDLVASARNISTTDEPVRKFVNNDSFEKVLVLKPSIEINAWSSQRGMAGFSSTPIILTARIWSVSGDLLGPDGDRESGEWSIIEDPWSQTVSLLQDSQNLQQAPVLRSFEPPVKNWVTSDRIFEEIAKVIGERRRGHSGERSESGTVRSMLLQNWPLDHGSTTLGSHAIFIPGWLINLETEMILHGRNGRLYDI